jgi:ABC-type multidrug transport system ATPase subunit
MGSSGAGKTTLMDVIALRKRSGTITGEVRLNGWLQESISFRRASGYVEQFDVQSPELSVRETVLFSAQLRLDSSVAGSQDAVEAFVDSVLKGA